MQCVVYQTRAAPNST